MVEDRKFGHVCDYDILVITKDAITALDTNLWHNIKELNNKLSVGQ